MKVNYAAVNAKLAVNGSTYVSFILGEFTGVDAGAKGFPSAFYMPRLEVQLDTIVGIAANDNFTLQLSWDSGFDHWVSVEASAPVMLGVATPTKGTALFAGGDLLQFTADATVSGQLYGRFKTTPGATGNAMIRCFWYDTEG